jgi:hypothetical protein
MRSTRNIHRAYTVEIATDAWGQVSHLPRDTYRAIQARLESLATLSSQASPESSGAPAGAERDFRMADLTLHYTVDARRRLIKLLRITRERSTAAVPTPARTEDAPG